MIHWRYNLQCIKIGIGDTYQESVEERKSKHSDIINDGDSFQGTTLWCMKIEIRDSLYKKSLTHPEIGEKKELYTQTITSRKTQRL